MPTILRALYAFIFASVAIEYVFLPYAFTEKGLSPADIGLLFTGRTMVVIVLQPKLSQLADRLQRPHTMLKIAVGAQFLGAVALSYAAGFAGIAAVVWVQACFRAPIVPVIDSTTVRAVGAARFGNVRLWGSLGFGACAAGVGRLAGELDYEGAGELALLLYVAVTAIAAIAALPLPRERRGLARTPAKAHGLYGRSFLLFIVWNSLHWMAIAAYNTFFSLYTKELELPADVPGDAMGVAILGEALAFWWAPRLFARSGAAPWVIGGLAVSIVRWWLTGSVTDPRALVALQALHFFTFGLWYAAAIERIGAYAGEDLRATFQGVFSAGVLALGSTLGSLGGGWLMELAGGATLFRVAALCDVAALLIALAAWSHWAGERVTTDD